MDVLSDFFSTELVHLVVDAIVFLYYKHSSLTARIEKQVRIKFGEVDPWTVSKGGNL